MAKGTQKCNLLLHSPKEDAMLLYQVKSRYWEKRIPDSVAMTTNPTQISCFESSTADTQFYKMNESATSSDMHAHNHSIPTVLSCLAPPFIPSLLFYPA